MTIAKMISNNRKSILSPVVVVAIASFLLHLWGADRQAVVIVVSCLFTAAVIGLTGKRKRLSLLRKRIIAILVAFPAFYLLVPLRNLIGIYIGFIIVTVLMLISSRLSFEKENRPDWEGEDTDNAWK